MLRNQKQQPENELHDKRCPSHRSIKHGKEKHADFQAKVFPVNVEDWQDNQIGEQECTTTPPKLNPPFQSTPANDT